MTISSTAAHAAAATTCSCVRQSTERCGARAPFFFCTGAVVVAASPTAASTALAAILAAALSAVVAPSITAWLGGMGTRWVARRSKSASTATRRASFTCGSEISSGPAVFQKARGRNS